MPTKTYGGTRRNGAGLRKNESWQVVILPRRGAVHATLERTEQQAAPCRHKGRRAAAAASASAELRASVDSFDLKKKDAPYTWGL